MLLSLCFDSCEDMVPTGSDSHVFRTALIRVCRVRIDPPGPIVYATRYPHICALDTYMNLTVNVVDVLRHETRSPGTDRVSRLRGMGLAKLPRRRRSEQTPCCIKGKYISGSENLRIVLTREGYLSAVDVVRASHNYDSVRGARGGTKQC